MSESPMITAFFGGTGTGELALIFALILLLFGPRKLPEIARMIGKALSQLRNASNDFREQIMRIDVEEELSPSPSPPVDVEAEEVDVAESDSEGDSVDDDKPAG